MQVCQCDGEVQAAFESVQSRSRQLFKDSGVFLERYYPKSHHIEVQAGSSQRVPQGHVGAYVC